MLAHLLLVSIRLRVSAWFSGCYHFGNEVNAIDDSPREFMVSVYEAYSNCLCHCGGFGRLSHHQKFRPFLRPHQPDGRLIAAASV